jgi:hypothetical protein
VSQEVVPYCILILSSELYYTLFCSSLFLLLYHIFNTGLLHASRLRYTLIRLDNGALAEWLRRGLQNLLHQFNSGRRLQTLIIY